jgi:hypothetical protein
VGKNEASVEPLVRGEKEGGRLLLEIDKTGEMTFPESLHVELLLIGSWQRRGIIQK